MNVAGRESTNAKDLVRFGGSTDAMSAMVIANGMIDEDENVAALAMSKAIDDVSATVKDQEMFGRTTSLEKKEASIEDYDEDPKNAKHRPPNWESRIGRKTEANGAIIEGYEIVV